MRWLLHPLRAAASRSVRGARNGTLIVQPLPGIGDMVWHLPHIHSIAAAEGQPVTVLTKPRSQADRLLIADAAVERVIWLKRNPGEHSGALGLVRLIRALRRERYAKAWLLHGSSRYALALLLAGIPVTIGYGRGWQRWLLSKPPFLPRAQTRAHPIELADALLAAHGVRCTEAEPVLTVDASASAAIAARCGACVRPWITLGIGSSEGYKQWGVENFSRITKILAARYGGTVFALGGPADATLASALVHRALEVVAITDAPIDAGAALLAQSAIFIGNDTGALNLAAAVGTHAVGLFGASPPLLHSRHIHPVQPLDPALGMRGIDVDTVMAEAARWLPIARARA